MTLTVAYCWAGCHYRRMAAALRRSIIQHNPDATIVCREFPQVQSEGRMKTHDNGHRKLEYWRDVVRDHTGNIVLLDADTLVLGDLSEAFAKPFDVACTVRDTDQPLNSGVAFVRASDQAVRFMDEWVRRNADLLERGDKARGHWSGLNERAYDETREVFPNMRFAKLPCKVWNCTDQQWRHFGDETRILHIKGPLRELCIKHDEESVDGLVDAYDAWRRYDR